MDVYERIAAMEHREAEPGAGVMAQEMKVLLLISFILTRLYRDGLCLSADVENDALAAGLKGRVALQLGVGLGGKGGMKLLRSSSDRSILLCQNNVINMVKRLGSDRLANWLGKEGITVDEFDKWFDKLPSAE